jgi:type II secretory pathway pseudopilin PulG
MKSPSQDASSRHRRLNDRGYIMVALLVAMAVAAVWMGAALPAWRQQTMREKEIELIFRGEQYARAIALYQIKNNSYPLELDQLVTQRFLRRRWLDPVTGKDFQTVGLTAPGQSASTPTAPGRGTVPGGVPGGMPSGVGPTVPGRGPTGAPSGTQPGLTGGITGVRSTSQATSIRIYNGQQQHNLWQFDAALMMARMGRSPVQPGQPGTGRGDGRGGPGREGGPAGPARGGAPGRGVGAPGRGGLPPPPGPPGGPGRGAGS